MANHPTESYNKSKLIASNTLVLFVRMFLLTVLNLFAVRLVLKGLGEEDYGIFNTIGGVITLSSFLSGVMALSVQRFYSFALGIKNEQRMKDIMVHPYPYPHSAREDARHVVALSVLLVFLHLFHLPNPLYGFHLRARRHGSLRLDFHDRMCVACHRGILDRQNDHGRTRFLWIRLGHCCHHRIAIVYLVRKDALRGMSLSICAPLVVVSQIADILRLDDVRFCVADC